jgi:hypothetical protein
MKKLGSFEYRNIVSNVTDSLTRLLEIMFSKAIPGIQAKDMIIDEVYFTSIYGNSLRTYNMIKTTYEAERFIKSVFDQQNSPHCCCNNPCLNDNCHTCVDLYKLYLHRSRELKKKRSTIYYDGLVYSFFYLVLIPKF